jgi:acyl-CoA synthetase (AMP-forming)/AMP-acid ligase II
MQALTAVAPDTEPPYTPIHEEDPYNIIYSSGTTGLPKGIVHTHAIRTAYCTSFATAYRITPESVILHTGSLVFNGAFLTLMPAMFQGCQYILHPYFDAQALIETVAREKVTHMMMVPSQIIAMLHAPNFDPANMQSLEMICSVGAPLHLEHKEALDRQLPGRFTSCTASPKGFVTILDKYRFSAKDRAAVGVPRRRCLRDAHPQRALGEDVCSKAKSARSPVAARSPCPATTNGPTSPSLAIRRRLAAQRRSGLRLDEDGFLYPGGPKEGPDHFRRCERLPSGH